MKVGLSWVVGEDVSKHPPWSIDISTITAPGLTASSIESVTTFGAFFSKRIH